MRCLSHTALFLGATVVLATGCRDAPEPADGAVDSAPPATGALSDASYPFAAATPSDPDQPENFRFRIGDRDYRVVWTIDAPFEQTASTIRLPLDPAFYVQSVQVAAYGGDVVLVYEATDSESGSGGVARIDPDGSLEWDATIPTFNIGEPAIRNDHLYLTGFGLIAKVELSTGRIAWLHDGLYDANRAFNGFDRTTFEGEYVLFHESRPVEPRAPKTLRVHDRTGRIMEAAVPGDTAVAAAG